MQQKQLTDHLDRVTRDHHKLTELLRRETGESKSQAVVESSAPRSKVTKITSSTNVSGPSLPYSLAMSAWNALYTAGIVAYHQRAFLIFAGSVYVMHYYGDEAAV
jgi:hypothetical protein